MRSGAVMAASKDGLAQIFYIFRKVEDGIAVLAILVMATLPVVELTLRGLADTGIAGSADLVQHLTLWVGFLGAAIAARSGRHLSFAGPLGKGAERPEWQRTFTAATSGAVAAALAWASYEFVSFERESATMVGGYVPVWMVEAVLPVSFALTSIRQFAQAGGRAAWFAAVLGLGGIALLGDPLYEQAHLLVWPLIVIVLVATILGAPIFTLLGGAAMILFMADYVPIAAIPVEAYRIVVSPSIPAIPLFTLAGFLLAHGKASERLVRLFKALFGWMPGGMVIATTLVCAFFSTFTGASGVTILALGGLLLPVLIASGHGPRFSTGLLTATGSIGLLFPPSLAVILYGVVARVPIPDLFVAGIIPGVIMLAAVAAYGILRGGRDGVQKTPFDGGEAVAALWEAKWLVLLPVIVIVAIFGGFTSLIEAAALTAVYALVIQVVAHKDVHPVRDLPKILIDCIGMLGGIFMILGVALGLTNYLVDAMIPAQAVEWVSENVDSKITFLLALNLFLLIVGCLMDIYSAIVVAVPLILPIATYFGIHPLHLGVIFLVNLELGYLTPPVGMNLFLASYRFDKPLFEVYRAALPFLAVLAAVLLLVTYMPSIILGL